MGCLEEFTRPTDLPSRERRGLVLGQTIGMEHAEGPRNVGSDFLNTGPWRMRAAAGFSFRSRLFHPGLFFSQKGEMTKQKRP